MKTKSGVKLRTKEIHGQPSWCFGSDRVRACLTELGGHLGPVTFQLGNTEVQPYSLAPWAEEKEFSRLIPILRVLRGDFFCAPFGGNATPWRGERHPVHGETANAKWRLESVSQASGAASLHASLSTRVRPGRVDKRIWLPAGHTAVYCQHTLSGMSGPMNLGHHAMLRFPDEPGSGLVSTSPFVYGQVFPGEFEQAAKGGYSSLKAAARFSELSAVPLATGGNTDLSRYPARRGYEDLVTLVSDPRLAFAWTAVTFPARRCVWFALKNPRILGQTVLWISNGGRHYPPWNGRHVGVMGLEEVTSCFHYGLAESARPNPLSRQGSPTVARLDPDKPHTVPYIMAMAAVPVGFNWVREIVPDSHGQSATLLSRSGKKAKVPLRLDLLTNGTGW